MSAGARRTRLHLVRTARGEALARAAMADGDRLQFVWGISGAMAGSGPARAGSSASNPADGDKPRQLAPDPIARDLVHHIFDADVVIVW